MGDLNLDKLRRLADDATPGPWEHDPEGNMGCGSVYTGDPHLFGGNIAEPSGDLYPRGGYDPKADMVFIAAARTAVPELIAEVERLRDRIVDCGHDLAAFERQGLRIACCNAASTSPTTLEAALKQRDEARAELVIARKICGDVMSERNRARAELAALRRGEEVSDAPPEPA